MDDGSKREVLKNLGNIFPRLWISIFLDHLVIKAIDLGEGRCLMVPSDQDDGTRIQAFITKQQAHSFNGVIAAINIVSQKYIFLLSYFRNYVVDQVPQVMELPMDVSDDILWSSGLNHIGLLQ